MRILPFGRVIAVHCCCDPGLRLGWVPTPPNIQGPGPVRFMAGYPAKELLTGEVHYPERIFTEVAWLEFDGEERTLAVKSNDVPIATWKKVPGFIEDRRRV